MLNLRSYRTQDEEGEVPNAFTILSHHKLLLVVGLIVVAALVAVVFYKPGSKEEAVASGTFSVSSNAVIAAFDYSGGSINQSMTVGCSVPASMKITCQDLANQGSITVYINDRSYATGTISGLGEVALSSGCGCSTVCICEIKVGENTIKISSDAFVGQLKYEIYVKS